MGAFWTDAQSLFETACQASQAGSPDCALAILVGPQGGIHMLEASGWALPSLLAQHGAQTVYRVTRARGSVCLEGLSGSRTCLLRRESPAGTARHLLAGPLRYAAFAPALLPGRALPAAHAQSPMVATWTISA